jgi:hypothetical protein
MKKSICFFVTVVFFYAGLLQAQQINAFKNLADMQFDRYGMACTTDGEFIYVFGGGTYSLNGYLDNIERYDPVSNSWQVSVISITPNTLNRRIKFTFSTGNIFLIRTKTRQTNLYHHATTTPIQRGWATL